MNLYEVLADDKTAFWMTMDPTQASAPILLSGLWTPYQTADARHDTYEAARRLNDWARSQGAEYWPEGASIAVIWRGKGVE